MARTQYDLTIIGGGSGGLTAARVAAALGANVLLIDKERLGGDCLNYGCVPSKSLIHVARIVQQARDAAALGLVPANLGVDMAKISQYIQGGRNTLIATGSRPATPDVEGLEEVGYLTNEHTFSLLHLPASIVIIGGGPMGMELGQSFRRLGATVTIIQGPDRVLPKEDPEVSSTIASVLRTEGINIYTGARFVKAGRNGHIKVVVARQGDNLLNIEADEILLALGRQPNVEGLNLEAAGVKYDNRGIQVDEHLQTSSSNILAIGDVTGGYLFTHVAAYQASVAVRNALVPVGKKKVDYRVVPWCTFTDPEAARIGLTPDEAGKQHSQVRIVKFPWSEIDRAQAENETVGFIKLVLAGKKDEIVGAHMVGARAGEMLGELSLAMQHNLALKDIRDTIHVYPTMSTGIQQTAFEAYLESGAAASNRKKVRTILSLRR